LILSEKIRIDAISKPPVRGGRKGQQIQKRIQNVGESIFLDTGRTRGEYANVKAEITEDQGRTFPVKRRVFGY